MKKLAALLMVLMLVLCAAAQAESEVVFDLSNVGSDISFGESCYAVDTGSCIEVLVDGDVVLTGSTNKPVNIMYYSGEITLRNVDIEAEKPEEDSIPFGMKIERVRRVVIVPRLLMPGEEEAKAPLVMNLEGMNRINFGMEGDNLGLVCAPALTLRGSGSLHTSLLSSGLSFHPGRMEKGDIVVEGGDIVASNSVASETGGAAIFTVNGSLTVKGGSVFAYNPACAYLDGDPATGLSAPGKVSAAANYVILAGKNVDTAQIVDEYKGEEYLEITDFVEPEIEPTIPETGDGANLVLWTLMLAASVIGVLSMRRKAY